MKAGRAAETPDRTATYNTNQENKTNLNKSTNEGDKTFHFPNSEAGRHTRAPEDVQEHSTRRTIQVLEEGGQ